MSGWQSGSLGASSSYSDPCSLLFISPAPESTLWVLSHNARALCPCPMEAVRNVASRSFLCQGAERRSKGRRCADHRNKVGCIVLFSVTTQNEIIDTRYILPYQKRRVGHWFDDGESSANKTYLDLPSFAEPPEYSIVVSADDDEYAGRTKVLQKVCRSSLSSHNPFSLR